MRRIIRIDNLKCGGCANTITLKIGEISGVNSVEVNIENSEIQVDANKEKTFESVILKLRAMGYPEEGTSNTIHKAKSYISCAIGKVS